MKRQRPVTGMEQHTVRETAPQPNEDAGMPDYRRHHRHPYADRVRRLDDGGTEIATVDLSAQGVGLLNGGPLATGELVQLAFLKNSIVVRGCVRHSHRAGPGVWRVGVEFLQVEHELAGVALAPT